MVANILSLFLVTALWCWGVHHAGWEGMVLAPFRRFIEKHDKGFAKPLITCPFCMPSLHGIFTTIAWYELVGLPDVFVCYVFCVPASSALVLIFDRVCYGKSS